MMSRESETASRTAGSALAGAIAQLAILEAGHLEPTSGMAAFFSNTIRLMRSGMGMLGC